MDFTREQYLAAVGGQLEPNIVNHCLALEACMGGIYDYLQAQGQLSEKEPPKDEWMLAGLLHDIDFAGDLKSEHPAKTREALAKYGVEIPDSVDHIIKAHDSRLNLVERTTKADWAIFCADSLTGLITAVAFVYPSRKLADVKLSSIVKRFLKDPKFAAGTRRNEVARCAEAETLNIPVEKFIEICFVSMQNIASEIGL